MIYVGKYRLAKLAGVDDFIMEFAIKQTKVNVTLHDGVACIVDNDILKVLNVVAPENAFDIVCKIIRHQNDATVELESAIQFYNTKLAEVARLSAEIADLANNARWQREAPTVVIKRPAPKVEPLVKAIAAEPKAKPKTKKSGTGTTPVCIKLGNLTKEERKTYDRLLSKTAKLFKTNGQQASIAIYNLMGNELVADLGKLYAAENGLQTKRVTAFAAPILAAHYAEREEVKQVLKDVI